MADKSIDSLNPASALQDGDTLVVFQNGETKKMAGSVLRAYVVNSAQPSVNAAAASAQAAEDSADAAAASEQNAGDSADSAETDALKAEGYAVGKQDGVDVPDTSPYKNNNAKHYKEAAEEAFSYASGYATSASRSANKAELWATGGIAGTPSETNNAKHYAEQAADSAEDAQDVLDSIPPDYTEAVRRTLAAFPQESAEGSVVDFADGADGLPVADLTVQIEGVQAGEGDPSPDNIRPITGWTGMDLRRTGKNLWGGAAMLADIKAAVPAATVDETAGEISYYSNAQSTHPFLGVPANYSKPYGMVFKENTQYTLILTFSNTSLTGTTAAANIAIHYTDGTYSSPSRSNSEASTKYTVAFVTARGKTVRDIAKITFYGHSTIYTNESGLFEGVLTADDFEPYVGTSYPITFPTEAGTVYGGSLDVTTGVLTVTGKYLAFDGTEDWHINQAGSAHKYYYLTLSESDGIKTNDDAVCSHFIDNPAISSSNDNVGFRAYTASSLGNRILIRPGVSEVTNTSTMKAWLAAQYEANTPVQVLYELASPAATYQLTPTEVTTLLGWNTLYADTGDVAVKYRADPQMYTDGRLAAVRKIISGVEDGFTASHNYAVGDFLIVGDALYRVTAAIATGGSITPDTNVTATTVAEQLKALYASIA